MEVDALLKKWYKSFSLENLQRNNYESFASEKIVPVTKLFVPFNDKEIIVVEGVHTEHEYWKVDD